MTFRKEASAFDALLESTFKLAAATHVGQGASFAALSRAAGRQINRMANLAGARERTLDIPHGATANEAWGRVAKSRRMEQLGTKLQQRFDRLSAARDQA